MKFMLDTNAVIAVQKSKNAAFLKKLKKHHLADIVISAVTLQELFYGAHKSQFVEHNLSRIGQLRFEVLPFDAEAARHVGQVRAELIKQKIGDYDVMIAGHARSLGLTVITHNTKEFGRVPGLKVQDWEA